MASSNKYSEQNLLQHIAEGDETAFRNLMDIYNPILLPSINKVVKDIAATEDILQETYLRIWLYRDKLPSIDNPRAWIFKIAYLRSFTYLQAVKNRDKIKEKLADNMVGQIVELDKDLDFTALTRLVKTAIFKLPAQQKKIYRLSREEGMSQNEIAAMLNLAPQSVKNTMSRALKFIRDYIEKNGYIFSNFPLLFFLRIFF